MDGDERKVEIPPHLVLNLEVRDLPLNEVEKVAASPTMSEQVQETGDGIRYAGTGWLETSGKKVTIEYFDTHDNRRIVLNVVTGLWNR